MGRRGYFVQENNLEDFAYPEEMIAAKSKSGFPDFILKISGDSQYSGGEFIELKDTKSHSIASFNSTIPSAKKRIDSLPKNIQKILVETGEIKETMQERDVYYLIRGVKQSASYPLSKTILVGGAFFETMSINEVLTSAFNQVALDSVANESILTSLSENFSVQQSKFAETRTVEKSAISVRFRVMVAADPRANLLNENKYPMIGNNTLTFLHHEKLKKINRKSLLMHDWESAPLQVKKCTGYRQLNNAYNDIDESLKSNTQVSIMNHPLNGPFFIAQASIHP